MVLFRALIKKTLMHFCDEMGNRIFFTVIKMCCIVFSMTTGADLQWRQQPAGWNSE